MPIFHGRLGATLTSSERIFRPIVEGASSAAFENVVNFERATKEGARVRTLLEVNNAIATNLNIRDLLRATSGCLRAYFKHDFSALALYDDKTDSLHVHAFDRAGMPDSVIVFYERYLNTPYFMRGDETKTGKTETKIDLLAIRRVQLRIDRELKAHRAQDGLNRQVERPDQG